MLKANLDKIRKTSGMGACILALFFIGSLFIIASGGGGGDGDSSLPSASLTTENTEEAVGGVQDSANLETTMQPLTVALDAVPPPPGIGATSYQTFGSMLTGASVQPLAEEPTCYEGSATLPEDESDWTIGTSGNGNTTVSATASFDNCVRYDVSGPTLNGTMTISAEVSGYGTSEPVIETMTFSTSNFEYTDPMASVTMTKNAAGADFSIEVDNFQAMMVNSLDAKSISPQVVAPEVSMRLNGRVVYTGTSEVLNALPQAPAPTTTTDTEFSNFDIGMRDDGSGGTEMTLDGQVKPQCMDGWLTVKTNTALKISSFAPVGTNTALAVGLDCPTAGDLTISAGDNTIDVEFTDTYAVLVSFNGGDPVEYLDCYFFDGVCSQETVQ